jgi:hypothetical protein
VRTFVVLRVAEFVRVHAVGARLRAITELDDDGVANFRADDRTENAEPIRLRLSRAERTFFQTVFFVQGSGIGPP